MRNINKENNMPLQANSTIKCKQKGKYECNIFMIICIKISLYIVFSFILAIPSYAGNNFFDQRYRGWLWFEEKPKKDKARAKLAETKEEQPLKPTILDMQKAREDNEAFKEKLDLHRHLTVRYPENIEYARMYRALENEMLEQVSTLSRTFMMTNFIYPDLSDQMEAPENIYGRRIKKDLKNQERQEKIKKIAKRVELFVFRQAGCMYSMTLEQHLDRFADRYGFSVEAVSIDESDSEYFKTYHDPELVKLLALEKIPTVVAVVLETNERFELARGAVAIPNLEDATVMLYDYLEDSRRQEQMVVKKYK